jgi:hypothetical protein
MQEKGATPEFFPEGARLEMLDSLGKLRFAITAFHSIVVR